MPIPFEIQDPSVTNVILQSQSSGYSRHDSIGPVVAVLTVIIVFCILSVMIGRLCSGRRIMGYGEYDIESWAESKCSTCIDGRISPPSSRTNVSGTSGLVSVPVQTNQETKVDDHSAQNPSEDS